MTTDRRVGSQLFAAIVLVISASCDARSEAQPAVHARSAPTPPTRVAPARVPESCLGVADKGIFGDLDDKVQLAIPSPLDRASVTIDRTHHVLVLWADDYPRKAYPLASPCDGNVRTCLRAGDAAELGDLVDHATDEVAAHDRDHDGIPDPLDILIGAKKAVLNADAYTEQAQGYIAMKYPGGDVPRTIGVCTDVIVRSVRNAGVDLQKALHEDILRRRTAYPMIRKAADANIDQRRVGTLLPYFKKHWEQHTPALDDPKDPLRPGDIILMDTFPSRAGPDHIGIISDTMGEHGLPLVINNWTTGTVTSEMDLLTFVPVLYRFRLPP
jgi:uncharacterized protein YijF (DUF1287 family)